MPDRERDSSEATSPQSEKELTALDALRRHFPALKTPEQYPAPGPQVADLIYTGNRKGY